MDTIRVLTRMVRQVPNRTAADGSVADAKRAPTTIHAILTDDSPNRRAADNTDNGAYTPPSAIRSTAHKGTGETDARTAGQNVGVAARSP